MKHRPIRKLLTRVSLSLLFFLFAPYESAKAQLSGRVCELTGRIDESTPRLMKEHKTPGVSIALIDCGCIVWRGCYGVKRAGADDPVTENTVFEACSMSKPLFAYSVMKLVENGKLDLDRPLTEYLDKPYLPDQPLHGKITARMVLNHTTGFPNWRKGGWRAGGPLPVNFEPGTKFGYSGEGFWYLQQVVEHILKERMEPSIQQSLLKPLCMTNSSYVWQAKYEKITAAGHAADGEVKTDRPLYERDNAAFSLYTTPTDYARFLIEMMTADGCAEHSLSRASIKDMLTPTIKTGRPGVLRGLGWAVTTNNDESYAWHSGSNSTGFRCYSRFHPDKGTGIVIMTNAIGGAKVWENLMPLFDQ